MKNHLLCLTLALATGVLLASPAQAKDRRPHKPSDDRGGNHVEVGDDRGNHVEPGDDQGVHAEPGDDHGRHGPGHHMFSGFDFSAFFRGLLGS